MYLFHLSLHWGLCCFVFVSHLMPSSLFPGEEWKKTCSPSQPLQFNFSSKICTFLISTTGVKKKKICKLTYHFCWPPQKVPENTFCKLYHFPPMCQFFLFHSRGWKEDHSTFSKNINISVESCLFSSWSTLILPTNNSGFSNSESKTERASMTLQQWQPTLFHLRLFVRKDFLFF